MRLRHLILYLFLFLVSYQGFAQSPLEFVENKGQWGDWFKFKTSAKGGDVCLEKDGLRYILSDRENTHKTDLYHHGKIKDKPVLKFHQYKVTFVDCNTPEITGEKPQKVYYNYFLGNDPTRWKSGIHPVQAVNYNGLYNGINMHISSSKGEVEYEFIVQPNADASQVKLKFEGQDRIFIKNHNLYVNTSVGQMSELKPVAFQYINNEKIEVSCEYQLHGSVLSYDFPDGYNHSQQLIIDPTVVFSTMTGSTADNWGYTATYDEAGNFYAGGLVNCLAYAGGGAFPVTPGAFQVTFGGGNGNGTVASIDSTYACDISIIKYDPTGVNRIYATYIGGSGNERPHSMIVDTGGNLIVAGRTRSTDYPVTPGCYQSANHGGWDIVVTKLNATGTALIGSTYIGGTGNDGVNFDSTELGYGELKYNYGDDARSEVQLDKTGAIFVADCSNSTDFPTTPGAISTTLSGMQDAVVIKFNSTLTSLLWSTYLGGIGSDAAYVLAFDTAQNYVYVAGGTNSTNFPVTAGTLHPTFQGGTADGFISKFRNSPPYNLQTSTYVGTSNYDQIFGIQVSGDDHVYVMGQSLGGAFPVTAGVYTNPNSCQFVMKTDNALTTDLISTVFGNSVPDSTSISPVAFLVDTCENVYISGWSGNLGLGNNPAGLGFGMHTSLDAVQPNTLDGRDFYFIVLGPGMTTCRYATYYGRDCHLPGEEWEGEHVDGGTSRFSRQGIIYQGICANCGGVPGAHPYSCANAFPTTSGVWSMVDSSTNCNEAALKIAFEIGPVTVNIVAGPSTHGCAPLTVNFTNLSTNVLTYVWNFGDGTTTSTIFSPSHTFTTAGVYTVTLNATNANACFRIADSAKLVISVGNNLISPDFTYVFNDSCGPYTATFTNTSVDTVGTPSYQWYFGDGGTFTGITPPMHTYPDTGTYVVMLIMTDTAACKSPDTIKHVIHFFNLKVSASFIIPDSICLGTAFTPLVTLSNATGTTWTFSDGTTSTLGDPSHTYHSVGTYTVTLVAVNNTGCKSVDSFIQIIKVLPVPTANFSYAPVVPVPNVPTTFTNLSINAVRYAWDFGDNTTSIEVNPVHQYNKTGSYKVCLTAFSSGNCPSMLCKQASADIEPLIGLPTAFSPNGDGENDILYVRGAAIETLDLKIFNRWGQLVFETTSMQKGWDGTFNGQPQPMEAYAYVLNATFIDGTAKQMKGNITLLR